MTSNKQDAKKVPAPRLRFPGFVGAWKEKKLGEITMMASGGTPDSSIAEYYGGEIPWVSISDMTRSGKYLNKTERNLSLLGLENSAAKVFPEKTILFAMYASIGKCNIADLPVSTSQAVLGIIPIEGASVEYIYYFLAANERKYADMGQHGTQKNLNAGMVKALPIPLPPTLPEQTRIAAALSSLDAVIAAQQSKQDALREHKRGLMAGLFPVESERVPRLRLPEFESAGEWEEENLGDIAMMSSGGTPISSVSEYYGGDIPWASISDMTKSGKYLSKTERNLTTLGLENSSAKIFPKNTILFAMYASIGKCNITTLPLSTSQAILGIIPIEKDSVEYIYYFLEGNKEKYADMGQHGTQKNLNAKMVKALPIPVPPVLLEQIRIAEVLSSIDSIIAAQNDKIETLQELKRALTHSLFPAGGEG